MRAILSMGLAVAAASGAQAVAAQDAAVSINARARTICTVELGFGAPAKYEAGFNYLGQMTELCNNVEGYRLVLDHPQGMVGAAILLDGQRIEIAPSASRTVIVDSSQPAYQEREIGLELASGADSLPMVIYAEPKGMIF